ncbi:MAG: hypothetical protein HQK89_03125 [Nitrospirae bacterium]|nr:hypothetical protein [Nitrospirota bacterium]
MYLKKNIMLRFLITALVIVIMAGFEYVNFIGMKKEILYLESTDTIRSKCLQLRRHEKNFFLYKTSSSQDEIEKVHVYIEDLYGILNENAGIDTTGKLYTLSLLLKDYEGSFNRIVSHTKELSGKLEKMRVVNGRKHEFIPLIELIFMEQPQKVSDFLKETFSLMPDSDIVKELKALDREIQSLRKTGETIIRVSGELDKGARQDVDHAINLSRNAILIFLPVFFIVGISLLFLMSSGVANRLNVLATMVEKAGKGVFTDRYIMPANWKNKDEITMLFEKFSDMSIQILQREQELRRKNEELLQTRKLAAIGTLAAGVAHELNNPLNNIYLSAQILDREVVDNFSPYIGKTIKEMLGQTRRVKRIVGDLLEFARGKELIVRSVDISHVIQKAYEMVSATADTKNVAFTLNAPPEGLPAVMDPERMERVFINLFSNAVDSMAGEGAVTVDLETNGDNIGIAVSDTGTGISTEDLDKIFEPFFSKKEKGTGLGLAIVYNTIEKHGGDIKVESEKGKGTTFYITIPVWRDGYGT